jgi:(2Fe-2S) ferredoxin
LPKQGTIQLCLKGDCSRRGGEDVWHALQEVTQGIPVEIKATGCMKQCKSGPNLVVLPAKARYQQVTPEQAVALVQTHFSGAFLNRGGGCSPLARGMSKPW